MDKIQVNLTYQDIMRLLQALSLADEQIIEIAKQDNKEQLTAQEIAKLTKNLEKAREVIQLYQRIDSLKQQLES